MSLQVSDLETMVTLNPYVRVPSDWKVKGKETTLYGWCVVFEVPNHPEVRLFANKMKSDKEGFSVDSEHLQGQKQRAVKYNNGNQRV